jgi:L,D-transpeptidase YcbB
MLAAAVLLLSAPGLPVRAQGYEGTWRDGVPGFGHHDAQPLRTSSEDARRRGEPLNDLRSDATPLRSEVMIEALEGAIQRYQAIVANGGWPTIPGTRMIRPEDDDERLPVLRQRLMISGELNRKSVSYGFSFSDDLEAAILRFQESHGLRASGRVDKSTLQALNVSASARLAQLRLNLQRLKELMAQRVEDRYILVNVPAFQLEAVEHYQVELRHRVIAGKPERQTPVVHAQIRALNFFPYWRVPDSVATLDLIPRLQKEPEYLQKEQIRVLTGSFNGPELNPQSIDWRTADASHIKFRQDPGPQNALGLVRLDMPNSEGVYMHDTPMKPLFTQRGRAFSAGCVRVQDVFTLVEWVARYEIGWDQPGRAQDVIANGQPLDLTLTRPVPVYFTYITAWAEPDGRVVFRPDIYGRDGVRELTAGNERDASEGPAPAQSLAP